jgi:hypothetical protein
LFVGGAASFAVLKLPSVPVVSVPRRSFVGGFVVVVVCWFPVVRKW